MFNVFDLIMLNEIVNNTDRSFIVTIQAHWTLGAKFQLPEEGHESKESHIIFHDTKVNFRT